MACPSGEGDAVSPGNREGRVLPHWLALLLAAVFTMAQQFHGPRWGDGLEFVAVSSHLGIAHPPGYPLFTLLGWLALKLPFEEPYDALLMLCRVSAFALVAALYFILLSLFRFCLKEERISRLLATNLAVAFCFTDVLRQSIHIVEIYILHAAFLAWMLWLLLRPLLDGRMPTRWEFLGACVLQGLAVANHLTSLAMLPLLCYFGVLLWRYRGGFHVVPPLALLVLIPVLLYGTLPLRIPGPDEQGIAWDAPETLSKLLDNLRGGEYRQFRFLSVEPGVPFTVSQFLAFIVMRLTLTLDVTARLFLGPNSPVLLAGVGGIAAVVFGFLALVRRGIPRLAVSLLALSVLLQLGFIFTYNIPDVEDYFLAIHVICYPLAILAIVLGARLLFERLKWEKEKGENLLRVFSISFLVIAYLANHNAAHVENAVVVRNWQDRLEALLPGDAALITGGDGDIYMAWYDQFARRERTDVFVYGANFVRFPWFRLTLPPGDPRREAVGFRPGPPGTFEQHISELSELVIDPLLESGHPVYTTIQNHNELNALSNLYHIRTSGYLLTEQEMELLANTHERFSMFPVLYEIQPSHARPRS